MFRSLNGSSGFSLLEVCIASGLLVVVASMAYVFINSSSATYTDTARNASLQESGRLALEEMARELRVADAATITFSPYLGSDRVQFRIPLEYTEAGTVWSPFLQYRYEPSEIDANGNGLQDDGRVVRVDGSALRTLTHSVVPGGLTLQRSGDNLAIRLQLSAADSKGKPIRCPVETSVTLRNRSGP